MALGFNSLGCSRFSLLCLLNKQTNPFALIQPCLSAGKWEKLCPHPQILTLGVSASPMGECGWRGWIEVVHPWGQAVVV